MKVAIPIWANKISPVFDVAEKILIVTHENGREIDRHECPLLSTDMYTRMSSLVERNVEVLICGAISLPMQEGLQDSGIEVRAHISGPIDDVLHDYFIGIPIEKCYAMPGYFCPERNVKPRQLKRCQTKTKKRFYK